jgi:hypothetical protein
MEVVGVFESLIDPLLEDGGESGDVLPGDSLLKDAMLQPKKAVN